LIEQAMVLVIIAVLAGIAMPPLKRLLSRSQLQAAQTDFIAALQHARETAVTTGTHTLLCPSRDGSRCSDDDRWDSGWLLGHDADHDNQPDSQPLYVGQGYGGKIVIRSSSGRHQVRFQPDGSAGGSNLTLLLCQPSGTEHALSVVVANSGRIRGAPASSAQTVDCMRAN
jgi:type IV fimbrial biogenesis protein FimT